MLAGIVFSLTEGWPMDRCLAFGAAAGVANASRWEVAAISRQDVEMTMKKVVVQAI
jgi:fructose-1-phosphate kinase PfkB-like protein